MKNKILLASTLTSITMNLNAQVLQENKLTVRDIQQINKLLEDKVLIINQNNQLSLSDQLKLEDLVELLEVDYATNCTGNGSCW